MDIVAFIITLGITYLIGLLINKVYQLQKEIKIVNEKNEELDEMNNFYIRENDRLKVQVSVLEEKEEEVMEKTSTIKKEKIVYNPIFKGKKAIVGNYDKWSSEQARKKLRSFGFKVDVVRTGDDIIDRIESGYKYDIIITNNLYQEGEYSNGADVLKYLRKLENFNTPVVVHTISRGQRSHFVDFLKFDEYLEKPLEVEELQRVLKKLLDKAKVKVWNP